MEFDFSLGVADRCGYSSDPGVFVDNDRGRPSVRKILRNGGDVIGAGECSDLERRVVETEEVWRLLEFHDLGVAVSTSLDDEEVEDRDIAARHHLANCVKCNATTPFGGKADYQEFDRAESHDELHCIRGWISESSGQQPLIPSQSVASADIESTEVDPH